MMRHFSKWLGLAVMTTIAAPVLAQGGGKTSPDSDRAQSEAATQQAPRPKERTAMQEDIEIMRRILTRDLHSYQQATCAACHGSASALAFSPDGKTLARAHSYGTNFGNFP